MFDVCVIGAGGIVGCAIVRELALQGVSVAGIEKHPGACGETSGLSSRVVHSGFHEAPGTLKAELARVGSRLIIQYAEEHGIALLHSGMLIAIPHGGIRAGLWREADALWNLWRQGRRQNPFDSFDREGPTKFNHFSGRSNAHRDHHHRCSKKLFDMFRNEVTDTHMGSGRKVRLKPGRGALNWRLSRRDYGPTRGQCRGKLDA